MAHPFPPKVQSLSSLAQNSNTSNPLHHLNHVEKELQIVLSWFQGWSGYQKQDFLKFLLDRALPQNVDTMLDAMGSLKVEDKPPNIFQCQLKLAGEWFAEWTDKERNDLMVQLAAIDADFVHTFNHEMIKIGGLNL